MTVRHRGYAGTYRRPSESDLRWMQYSNLAYGAKRLWYFFYWEFDIDSSFDDVAIVTKTGEKTELYTHVRTLNNAILAMGPTLLTLTSEDVVHTHPPGGEKAFIPNANWISRITAKDALVVFFRDPTGTPYALVVNKQHGKDLSAASTADSITLGFQGSIRNVEAVNWLDGKPGPLTLTDGKASLVIAGGTGVLLRATHQRGSPTASALTERAH